jgi:cation diffusion facilitator family transporter
MDKNNQKQATFYGKLASVIGIIVNILLAVGKIVVGTVFGLISVVADGLNNLTDCGSSTLSLISFKLSAKPADKEHPFGHERIEYICSLTVAFLVLLIAFNTIKDGVSKIIEPTEIVFSYWIIVVLSVSVLAKLGLFAFYKITAKKINSLILSATAIDSLSDCVSTFITIISFIVGTTTGFSIDGYAGIVVALFIGWSAIGLLKETFSNLIGKAPDKTLLTDIKNRILSHEGVLAIHDLSVYSYGPNKFFASAHIEVPASVDVLISHELVDEIERDFAENTNVILTGHLDPIETDNPEVIQLKKFVDEVVSGIDKEFTIHDLRIVKGERQTNVLFDVVIPYETTLKKDQIKAQIEQALKELNPTYRAVMTIEYGL